MKLEDIGHEIRRSRLSLGLTQAQLAAAANITRTTLSQLENGVVNDLGVRKIEAVLDRLGLELLIDQAPQRRPPDFLRLASTAASVSFKTPLSAAELRKILLTGQVPVDRRAQMRVLLEEAPKALIEGLVQQMRRSTDPGKVERNLVRVRVTLGLGTDG